MKLHNRYSAGVSLDKYTADEQKIVDSNMHKHRLVYNVDGGVLTCHKCGSKSEDDTPQIDKYPYACSQCKTYFDACISDTCSYCQGCTSEVYIGMNCIGYGCTDKIQHVVFPELQSGSYWQQSIDNERGIVVMWCPCCGETHKSELTEDGVFQAAVQAEDFVSIALYQQFLQQSLSITNHLTLRI